MSKNVGYFKKYFLLTLYTVTRKTITGKIVKIIRTSAESKIHEMYENGIELEFLKGKSEKTVFSA